VLALIVEIVPVKQKTKRFNGINLVRLDGLDGLDGLDRYTFFSSPGAVRRSP
jgi:hypothetical protein